MTVLYNLARVSTATTGTGTITLGSAITGYLTFAQAGVTNGTVVSYGIRDGANSEVGTGTYTASGTTLTRNVLRSTVAPNYNTPITLSGSAEVYITALSEDILNKTTSNTMLGALTLPNTGLKVQDTDASNVLSIVPGSDLTANRTLTWTTGDSDRNITLTGNTTIPPVFPTSTTDKGIPRFSGTAGSFQTSLLAVDDSGNITGANSIDIGNADTTITRASAGVIQVEGSNVLMASNIGSTVQGYSANLNSLSSVFTAASALGPASLKLYEDTDNGSQYVELIAPNSIVTSNKQASLQDVTGTLYITNGQDVAVADGGTGASDAATARSNLGLGSIATQDANNVSVTGGAISGTAINGFTGNTAAITIGTNQFVKDVSGNVGIGCTPSSILNVYNATDSTILNQSDTSASIISQRSSQDNGGPQIISRKSRGTIASPTAVASGDGLGQYQFQAYGGTNFKNIASIRGAVDTYTSDTDISSLLIFNTSPSGAAAGQERMRITSSGNVGIGTISPAFKLQVNDFIASVGTNSGLRFGTATDASTGQLCVDGTNTYLDFAGALLFRSAGSFAERMRIDSNGKVGIGLTPLGNTLSVATDINIVGGTSSQGGLIVSGLNNQTYGAPTIYMLGSSNGTSYAANGTGLGSVRFQDLGSYAGGAGISGFASENHSASALGGGLQFFTTPNGTTTLTERMRITAEGEVWVARATDAGAFNLQCGGTGVWGAGAYTNGSDERIKENIAPLESGMDVLQKLNPVTFQYKEDWSKNREVQTGFIAQDLLVAFDGQNYKDGIVDQSGEYLSVAYQSLIPILVKALQELKEEFDAYKTAHP